MRALRSLVPAALVALLLATPVHAWPNDPTVNVPVCTAANAQQEPRTVSDGAGGAIVVWSDLRSGSYDLYAQRVSAAGAPLWAANGIVVCNAGGSQTNPLVVSDGNGGAIVSWLDVRSGSFDLYAQRLSPSGVPQWTANGVAVCTAAGAQTDHSMAADGSGGALIAWADIRGATYDIYAQRLNGSGVAQWTANGVVVCNQAGDQSSPDVAPDAFGGAVIAWEDFRSGTTYDLYAQRVTAGGGASWTANGVAVSVFANDQAAPCTISDGQGGAYVVWMDNRTLAGETDVYMQHLTPGGANYWTAGGVTLCTASGSQRYIDAAPDASSGFFVTWRDSRNVTQDDVYAQRVGPDGFAYWTANGVAVGASTDDAGAPVLTPDGSGGVILMWDETRTTGASDVLAQRLSSTGAAQWTSGGVPVCTAQSQQVAATGTPDGAGGVLIAWSDARNYGTNYDIYCQRVERYGQLGNPEPVITSVSDVKNDQGGFVKLVWNASYLDADPTYGITEYRVFRSAPGPLLANGAPASSRATTTDSDEAVREGKLLLVPNGAQVTSWEFVGTQAAEAFASYSRIVATTADSAGGSNPRTYFLVEARASTSISSDRWSSAPDSGYSVDNLAPAAPAPLTGQYAAGTTQLHWNRNTEADLAGYKLYRGSSAAFVPSPANFVAQLPDTGAADAAGAPYVYKLTAVDVHGNESPVATLIPSGTLSVGDGATRAALSFAAPSPNPARGSATLRYSLSARGHVKLALFDAAGRRVATVADGVMEAGEHSATLALRDDAGRELPAGLYLARLEAEGRVLTRRIAAVR